MLFEVQQFSTSFVFGGCWKIHFYFPQRFILELFFATLTFFFPEPLMSILCFLRLPASDGGWAAPVSVWLSAGPGCQRPAGDPWSLRLLRHPGAAKCQRGKCSLYFCVFFSISGLFVRVLFLVWDTQNLFKSQQWMGPFSASGTAAIENLHLRMAYGAVMDFHCVIQSGKCCQLALSVPAPSEQPLQGLQATLFHS